MLVSLCIPFLGKPVKGFAMNGSKFEPNGRYGAASARCLCTAALPRPSLVEPPRGLGQPSPLSPPSHRSLLPSHRSLPSRIGLFCPRIGLFCPRIGLFCPRRSLRPRIGLFCPRISAFGPGIVPFPAGQRRRAAVLTSKKPKVDGNGGLRPIPSTFYERRFAKVDGFWRKASNPSTFRRISGHTEAIPRARERVSPRKSPKSR